MSIITARNGDEMLVFQTGKEPAPLEDYPDLPLIFSCIVPRYKGGVLYVYNAERKEWELPSGMIEAGETPYEAAVRELQEESGQIAPSLTYVGVCLLRVQPDMHYEFGAIYTCELDNVHPFQLNEETAGMMLLWGAQQAVNGHINEIGIKLAELA
jgi:8-oxo-dGTP diphosphatase